MLWSGAGLLRTGEPAPVTPVAPTPANEQWLTPTIDIRARYGWEYGTVFTKKSDDHFECLVKLPFSDSDKRN